MRARGHPTPGSRGPNWEGSRRSGELLTVVHRPLGPGPDLGPGTDLSPGTDSDPEPGFTPDPEPGLALDPGFALDPGLAPHLGVGVQGLAVLAAGQVEEDAGAEGEEEQGPDPLEAQGLVGSADEEQQAEAGEDEPEGEGDRVELVAVHGPSVVGGAGRVGLVVMESSNGPASWKARGSLARRTSITP